MTFVEKVLTYLKGGDEAKVSKFKSDTEKYLNRQIKAITDENEELLDKIGDAKDALNDVVLNVNLDRIKTTEDRKEYIEDYIDDVEKSQMTIKKLEKELAANNELLALRKSQLSLLS